MSLNGNHSIKFSEASLAKVREIIKRYPEGRQKSALLPVLHMAQEELGKGWLPVEVMDYVASLLNIQPIEVYEVVTFYTMYNQQPVGRHMLEVCITSPCCVLGAEELVHYLEKKLGIKAGETTPDRLFTIKPVECLAACGYAPMMQVGEHYYENLTEEKVDRLLEKLRNTPYPAVEKIEI
ncbi:MAG TPA: NAD(P)H-dependent oxidoreductase subunit E [Chitinophagales bacterium]|nr:NAD(P)H-dependent oxidoreductase subunit E [Chitinophagales bacterium]